MERTCSSCGKKFFVKSFANYQYKCTYKGERYSFCCYNCWSKFLAQKEKEKGEDFVMVKEDNTKKEFYALAEKIIKYQPKKVYAGGNACNENVSATGKIIKYLMAYRDVTFSKLRPLFKVKTVQAVSQKINRWRDDQFEDDILDKILKSLKISRGYFENIKACVLELENGERKQ